jgi:hypothetical protein
MIQFVAVLFESTYLETNAVESVVRTVYISSSNALRGPLWRSERQRKCVENPSSFCKSFTTCRFGV